MAEYPCGRSQLCEDCVDITTRSQRDVCLAVAYVVGLSRTQHLTFPETQALTRTHLERTVDDDDVISLKMKEAAATAAFKRISGIDLPH
jgi:hypothetical protein